MSVKKLEARIIIHFRCWLMQSLTVGHHSQCMTVFCLPDVTHTRLCMYAYCMWQESQDHSDLYTTSNQILEVANSLDQGYWYTVCRYISTKFSVDYKHSVVRVHLSWCLWNLLFECSNDVKKAAANPGPSQEQKVKKIKATGGVQLVIGSKKSPVKKTPPEAAPEVITPPPPLFT